MSDERGLRFETGLIVILVMFFLAIGGMLAFQSMDARLEKLESIIIQGVQTAKGAPQETGKP